MFSLRSISLNLSVFLISIAYGTLAQADTASTNDAWITRNEILTSAGPTIPAGAFGVLLIKRPRKVTLLSLRGYGGRGEVILRSDEPGTCLALPIRFVAGDFGGNSISGRLADPIHLVIKSRRVAKALARGYDIVSDAHRVSGKMHPDAEMVLISGLDESSGFIINPGRNIFDDIFGADIQDINCNPA